MKATVEMTFLEWTDAFRALMQDTINAELPRMPKLPDSLANYQISLVCDTRRDRLAELSLNMGAVARTLAEQFMVVEGIGSYDRIVAAIMAKTLSELGESLWTLVDPLIRAVLHEEIATDIESEKPEEAAILRASAERLRREGTRH